MLFDTYKFIQNGVISIENFNKFVDSKINDADWNKVMKNSFNECYTELPEHLPAIEASFVAINVTKKDCNPVTTAMTECFLPDLIEVSRAYLYFDHFVSLLINRIALTPAGIKLQTVKMEELFLKSVETTPRRWKNTRWVYMNIILIVQLAT